MATSHGTPVPATSRAAARPHQLRILIALALPLVVAVIIAGCGDQAGSGAHAPAVVHVTATAAPSQLVPDPKEVVETLPPGTLPQFVQQVKGADEDKVAARYSFAVAHKAELAQVPCYCGCALYQHQHTSLQSCYIKSVSADGQITYTDHSVSCDICAGEVDMMQNLIASTPLRAIREQIDTKYHYTGVWTDTPPVQ